jgi:hypothetical protein
MNKYLKKAPKNLGMLLLSVWLILMGLIWLVDLDFDGLRSLWACWRFAGALLWERYGG